MNKMDLDAYENYNMEKALLGVLEEGIEKLKSREEVERLSKLADLQRNKIKTLERKLQALESLDTRYILTKSAEKELAAMGKENKK